MTGVAVAAPVNFSPANATIRIPLLTQRRFKTKKPLD